MNKQKQFYSGDPIALSVPVIGIRRQFAGGGSTSYYTDSQNPGKTPYFYDPPNSYFTGNLTKDISFIYDRPELRSTLNWILDGNDEIQYNGKKDPTIGKPDSNAPTPEVGGIITATFDDYAVNTKTNAILAYAQWTYKVWDIVGGAIGENMNWNPDAIGVPPNPNDLTNQNKILGRNQKLFIPPS